MDHERIAAIFAEHFTQRGEIGASLSVWLDGREVVSLSGGSRDRNRTLPWGADTAACVWSATKGPAAACVLHAMEAHGLTIETCVADVWPEFAQAGKAEVTLAQALSHQAGVPVLDKTVDVFDHAAVAGAIAEQAPHWPPGTAHGYGPRAQGFLLDELVRRITGLALGEYWRLNFADPLGLDFWIGLPPEMADRVADVFPGRSAPPKGDRFGTAFATPESFTTRAFRSPAGLQSVAAMNSPAARAASLPGFGGIGTARALGKFYAMLACGGSLDGRKYFSAQGIGWMTTTLARGDDRVLLMDTAFSAGFMRPSTGGIFGARPQAFGHPGAGGSHAFADPEQRLSFAYVMNQMEPGVLPGPKSLLLVAALENR